MRQAARIRIVTALLVFVATSTALAADTGELPQRLVGVLKEDFATGEFAIVVLDRARKGPHEIWSYDPETDDLQHVMTAPNGWPLDYSRLDCCVLWDQDAKRVHVGGIGRDTVTHRFGSWAPDVEVAGRDLEYYSPGLVGEPPRLLLTYKRTLWTFLTLFGEPERRETTKRWLELRDPWSYAKLATISEVSESDHVKAHRVREVSDNTCLIVSYEGARFLSLDPFQFVGRETPFGPFYNFGNPVTSWDGTRKVTQRLHIDAEALTVTLEEVDDADDFLKYKDFNRRYCRNGLLVARKDYYQGPIEVQSAPAREPAIATSFDPGRDYFWVHTSGQYVITYDGSDKPTCDTADIWSLTPEGTFTKTRTLTFKK